MKVPLRARLAGAVGKGFRARPQYWAGSFLIMVLLFCAASDIKSQTPDYREIFGDNWKKAEQFVTDNENWIRPVLEKYKVDYFEALAVIFPELVRYSALRDKMEITLLKALYVNIGKEYANFSIGQFQMKPSFAENIITEGNRISGRRRPEIADSSAYENMRSYRSAIVSSLEDVSSQLDFLVIFFRIMGKRFDLKGMDQSSRIRFLASAYNYGFMKSEKEIFEMSERKFYSTKLISKDTYSYADISLYWFRSVQEKNKEK